MMAAGETKHIAQMFEAIMTATHGTALQVARLDERLEAHMESTSRRFEELQNRERQMCAFRHGEVDDRLEHLEKSEETAKADAVRKLEKEVASRNEVLNENKRRGFEWKKYSVSVGVGVLMLLLSTIISYHMGRLGRSASAAQPPPAAVSVK
jgi:beta-glucosidase-like glycosyl hydrolase